MLILNLILTAVTLYLLLVGMVLFYSSSIKNYGVTLEIERDFSFWYYDFEHIIRIKIGFIYFIIYKNRL